MRLILLTSLLVTMASAAALLSQSPKVGVSYTDGKTTTTIMNEYGVCVPIALPDGKYMSYFHVEVKSQCEYFYDEACTYAAKPPKVIEPGNYKVEHVKEYGKCAIVRP